MSEEPVIEKRKNRPNRIGLRKLGAIAGIALTAPGTVAHNLMHPAPAEAATQLTAVEQSPGYGKKVSPEIRKELRDSHFNLIRQQKGYEYLGGDNICSGFLINYHGKTLGVTAKHCIPPGSNNFSWAIEGYQAGESLAKVSKWSFKPNSDSAFLSFNPKSETTAFKKLRPLNASMLTDKTPELGQPVASIGFDIESKQLREGTGTLLGKVVQKGQTFYVVGAHVANENANPYRPGVSGMAFVTPKKELIGSHSSVFVRSKHLPDYYVQSIKDASGGSINTLQQVTQQNDNNWRELQHQLKIKIPEDDNYALLVQAITPNDAVALERGLN